MVTPSQDNTINEATTNATTTTAVTNGRVKWFNTKAGYGFITLVDAVTKEERDVFVHHSELQVTQSQYKYLVQGEYVDCVLAPIEKDGHSEQATQVCGVNGGKLMCETRNEARANRTPTQHAREYEQQPRTQQARVQQSPRQRTSRESAPRESAPRESAPRERAPRESAPQDRRPQLNPADEGEWMIVRRRTNTTTTPQQKKPATQANRPPRQRQPGIEIE
jgi:cold shock CspA family protein